MSFTIPSFSVSAVLSMIRVHGRAHCVGKLVSATWWDYCVVYPINSLVMCSVGSIDFMQIVFSFWWSIASCHQCWVNELTFLFWGLIFCWTLNHRCCYFRKNMETFSSVLSLTPLTQSRLFGLQLIYIIALGGACSIHIDQTSWL